MEKCAASFNESRRIGGLKGRRRRFGRLVGTMTGEERQAADAKIGEKRSDTGTRESLRSVDRVRVPASMKLNLIPASSRARSSEAEVGGGGEGGVADHRHPRKGGAPRGVRLTRHPAGSSHSYCQLPTLRPSRSSLASDLRSFQPLSACSSYVADLTFLLLIPARHSYTFVIANRIFQLGPLCDLCLPFCALRYREERVFHEEVEGDNKRGRENSRGASRHNRNETTKIRSQNHLGLLERKKNDDAFAEVIVYKIYMSPVHGSIRASLCVIKEGRPMALLG